MSNKIIKIINIIILIILIPILLVSTVLIAKSYINKEEVPNIFGYAPLIVLSGSMETEISTGDLVIVKKVDEEELKENDIIAFFTDENKETIITHRIIEIKDGTNGQKEYITKGDNNNVEDKEIVQSNLIVGKYQNIKIKGLGNAAIFLQTPTGMIAAISIPIFIIIIIQYIQNRMNKKEIEELKKSK